MLTNGDQCYPTSEAFSRQQVHERTGIADDILAFWIKQNLLIPFPSRPRQHRRFGFEQLHIAVVLNAMRSLGANVGVLRNFADAFQTGFVVWKRSGLRTDALSAAVRLSERLNDFAAGKEVRVHTSEADFDGRKVAENEAQIVESWMWIEAPDGADRSIVAFAKQLSPYEASSIGWALDLTGPGHLTLNTGDAWIAWVDPTGSAKFSNDAAIALHHDDGPLAAFYIPLARLIKSLWRDRLEAAQYKYGISLHNSRIAMLIDCEAAEPARAAALRTAWDLPDDWRKTYQPIPEDDDMSG